MYKKNDQVSKVQKKILKMKIKHVEEGSSDETMKKNQIYNQRFKKIMLPLDSTIYSSKC
jgi:hypothetical protein